MKALPNIVLITSDQQRFDTVGPAAPDFMRTPHLDHLRYEGITFSAAYADCPICVPARMSLMTGKHATTHGMTTNGRSVDVMGHDATLPALLSRQGYQTAAIGKMHFNPQRLRHGFQEMILPADYYREMGRSGSALQPMRHGLGQTELYPTMATVPESLTLTSWISEQCVQYIRERRDPSLPFFLWCSYSKPHPPFDPPEPYYSMYRGCAIPEPVIGDWVDPSRCPESFLRVQQHKSYDLVPAEVIREVRAAYYGLLTQIDYNIGRVFAALKDMGLLDEALILYTSDHGEYLGDHRMGGKVFLHDVSARVPFVLRLPKSWSNRCHGTTVDRPVSHADILPTLVEAAAEVTRPEGDGQSLIALARGEIAAPQRFVALVAANYSPCDCLGITDGRWKYLWYPEGASEQSFDLAADPYEARNLAGTADHAQRMEGLKAELIAWHQQRRTPYLVDGQLPVRPVVRESVADRRNRHICDYRTEYSPLDMAH